MKRKLSSQPEQKHRFCKRRPNN